MVDTYFHGSPNKGDMPLCVGYKPICFRDESLSGKEKANAAIGMQRIYSGMDADVLGHAARPYITFSPYAASWSPPFDMMQDRKAKGSIS
jgi:hypothetical protein